ncbi:MAG: hypothetical protein IJ532_02560 [Alphaproteobacteria bacterium]|nr:hypothetical protein [Alphaproteobacteria bacterium]
MEKNELISLIEDNNPETFSEKVFKNSVVGGGGSFYTIPLSQDEEKALAYRVSAEQKDSRWYKILRDYISHYPLCNETVKFLATDIKNSMAVKIACTEFKSHGYSTELVEYICRTIKKEKCDKVFYPLLSSISKYGHSFSYDLYRILGEIDETIREHTSVNPEYAELYKKKVDEYRKQNGLLNFHS